MGKKRICFDVDEDDCKVTKVDYSNNDYDDSCSDSGGDWEE